MFPEDQTYSAPFYIFRSGEFCLECSSDCRVVALASGADEPFIFSNIIAMPDEFLLAITAVHPNYEKHHSPIAEMEFFMNRCDCGAHFEDFDLCCEPGGAFFPTEDEEAAHIEVIELPIQGSHRIGGSPGMGIGGLILSHGKRVAWAKF